MNASKADRVLQGLTSLARKTYEAVPIGEAWEVPAIMAELRRSGCSSDQHHIRGCLRNLIDHGLVREPKDGEFQREVVKETPVLVRHARSRFDAAHPDIATPAQDPQSPAPHLPPKPAAPDPFDRLAMLASRARSLSDDLLALAVEADEVALEFETRHQSQQTALEDLRQLRALLGKIGMVAA